MKHMRKLILIFVAILALASTLAAQPHTSDNYTLSGARIIPSGGKAISGAYTLDNVAIGNFVGGKAVSAAYTLRAGVSVSIVSTGEPSIIFGILDWNTEDPIEPGGIGTGTISVTNIGNVKINLEVRVEDKKPTGEKGGWLPGNEGGANSAPNTYLMSAVFTNENMQSVEFNEGANKNEDFLSEGFQASGSEKFAYTGSAENGVDIMPNESRTLWLKFEAPHVDTTGGSEPEEHYINIEVKAN